MSTLSVITSTGNLGGAEVIETSALAQLVASGVRVEAAVPFEGSLCAKFDEIGVHWRVIPSPKGLDQLSRRYAQTRLGSLGRIAADAAMYQLRLARWLIRERPTAVLALGFRAQLAVSPVARLLRIRLGWNAMDFMPEGPIACRLWSAMARRMPAIVTSPSQAAASQPALHGCRVVHVAHPGIETAAFTPRSEAEREPLVLLIGHLTPLKNHLGFLDALRQIRETVPGATGLMLGKAIYTTAGHDEYVAEVNAAVDAFEPGGAVALRGADASEVRELLERASVLLHLSTAPETFGMVCLEAMAAGCVVVGFDQGATPEVLGDAGLLAMACDVHEAAELATELLADPARRAALADAGRTRAASAFELGPARERHAAALRAALRL